MRLVLLLLGSSSSGKTTQANLLHKAIGNGKLEVVELEPKVHYSRFGDHIGNIGIVKQGEDFSKITTSGADTLRNKDGFRKAMIACGKDCTITISDAIMTTGTWWEFIAEIPNVRLVTTLLHFNDIEDNVKRVRMRMAEKKRDGSTWKDIEWNEKKQHNLVKRWKFHRGAFERNANGAENAGFLAHKQIIDASLPKNKIHKKIMKQIINSIK